jgi:acyl-CoA reductase-like NAD-dependent aldehyde dehydrogenase
MHAEMLIDGFFIGGPCDQAVGKEVIRAPYDGKIVGTAAEGGWSELKTCLDAAHDAFQTWQHSPRHQRQTLLRNIARIVRERSEELAELLTKEVGKPITASRGEVARLALTFDYAADLVTTFGLESLPVDTDPRGTGYRCTVEHFPLGVIFCIVPYNWPYNLTAHKIAPALATGNTVVVKPSPLAPLSTLTLLRIIHEAGCPPGVVNGWNGHPSLAQRALADPRVRMLSFTGSAAIGWKLKELMPDRRVALELGGDASVIICEDANLDWAIQRTVAGAFGYAGQICISIQHVLIQSTVYEQVKQRLIDAATLCLSGDPMLPTTVCGPLISSSAADKVMAMIEEATAKGATILAGGTREGNIIHPTLIENVSDGTQLACEEAFGPVLTIAPFETLDDAIKQVNASQYGIQAGVFTESASNAEKAYRTLEVGGVIINDYPTLRFDNMPYGGVKRSGFGREGVQYTMAEMTTPKTLLVRT